MDQGFKSSGNESVAFESEQPDRGYTVKASYLNHPKGDALVEIFKDGEPLRAFLFPAYKVWNIAAHFKDIVDGEIQDSARGYEMAAWGGIPSRERLDEIRERRSEIKVSLIAKTPDDDVRVGYYEKGGWFTIAKFSTFEGDEAKYAAFFAWAPRDIDFLLGQLNVVTELWNSAEKELDARATSPPTRKDAEI